MKKCVLAISALVMTACSTSVQQSSVPMDMNTVQEYQQRVSSASASKVSASSEKAWELNQSDTRPKAVVVRSRPAIYPSVHYGYGWGGHHRHHSGVGVGLGYY